MEGLGRTLVDAFFAQGGQEGLDIGLLDLWHRRQAVAMCSKEPFVFKSANAVDGASCHALD
jgi:hypothetical protein